MTTSTDSLAPGLDGGRERLLTPAFVRLSLGDLGYFTAAGVAIYTLPVYVTGPVGADEAGAGLAFGAFAVTALVLRPFAGRLSDTHGRRPLLLGGALVAAVAMLLTAHAETLAMVVALRLALGVAEAAFFVASFAALADLAPPSRMGEALSYNSLGLYLGLALGPPLGDLLVHTLGYTAAWYGAAGLLVLAAVVVHGIGETRDPRPVSAAPASLIHWRAVPPALGFLASVVAMGGFLAFASLQAGDVGLRPESVPVALYGVVVVVCRIAFAKVPDRLPALPLGAAALAAIASGLAVMALWPSSAGMLLGADTDGARRHLQHARLLRGGLRDRFAVRARCRLRHRQRRPRPGSGRRADPAGGRGAGGGDPVGVPRGRRGRPGRQRLDLGAGHAAAPPQLVKRALHARGAS